MDSTPASCRDQLLQVAQVCLRALSPYQRSCPTALVAAMASPGLSRGSRSAVLLSDDRTLWREYVIARHLEGDQHIVVTPEEELQFVALGDAAFAHVREVRVDRTVAGGRNEDLAVIALDRPCGDFSAEELAEFFARADFLASTRGFGEIPRARGLPPLTDASDNRRRRRRRSSSSSGGGERSAARQRLCSPSRRRRRRAAEDVDDPEARRRRRSSRHRRRHDGPFEEGGAPLAEPLAAAATLAGTDDDSVMEGNAPLSEPRAASTSPAGASDYSRPEVDEDDVVPRSPSGERLDRIKAELIAAELHRPAPQPPGYWPLARAARKAAIVAAQAVAGEEDLLGPPDPDAAEGDAPAKV